MARKKAPTNRAVDPSASTDEKPEAAKKADKKAAAKPDAMVRHDGRWMRADAVEAYDKAKAAPRKGGAMTTQNSGGLVG